MSLVAKTLWYIESHLGRDLTLSGIAADMQVSPFHLARAFAVRTGQPVMRYVWRRRLTRAAQALQRGGDSVLAVALDAGYGSHEAFSRAFRAEFGVTPNRVRTHGATRLPLTQPMEPVPDMTPKLVAPAMEAMPERVLVGPSRIYDLDTRVEIPGQWAAYNDDGSRAPNAVGDGYYGAVHDFTDDGRFGYLSGQEVRGPGEVPKGFTRLVVPAGRFARFATRGHISTIGGIWGEVYEHWMTQPGYRPRQGSSLEYYPPEFDPVTGDGGFEVWVPVE